MVSSSIFDRFVARYGRLPTEFDTDYLEMLQMTKYRIIPVPDFRPSKCANCGSTKEDGRKYIDFGLQVDWYGVVYLCSYCVNEIAREMGLFAELEARLDAILAEAVSIKELQDQGERLHDTVVKAFKEFEEFYGSLHTPGYSSDSDASDDLGTNETASDKSTTDETESTITKPTSSPRRKNVSSLAEFLTPKPGDTE